MSFSQNEHSFIMVDVKSKRIEKVLAYMSDVCSVFRISFTNEFAIAKDFDGNQFIIDKNFRKVSSNYKEIVSPESSQSKWFEDNFQEYSNCKFLIFTEVVDGKTKKGVLEITDDPHTPVKLKIPAKFDYLRWDAENFIEGGVFENGKEYLVTINNKGIPELRENLYTDFNFNLEKKFSEIKKSLEQFNENKTLTQIPIIRDLQNGFVAINIMNAQRAFPTVFTHSVYNIDKQKVFSSRYEVMLYCSAKKAILTSSGYIVNEKDEKLDKLPGIEALAKDSYSVLIHKNYFNKLGFAWIKIVDKNFLWERNFLLNKDFKIILSDFLDLSVWKNGSVVYRDKNEIWNTFNYHNLTSSALPSNFLPEVIFLGSKPYYYFKYIDPNSSVRYLVKFDNSTQELNNNWVFALEGESDIITLKDLFPQAQLGNDFYIPSGGDIFQNKIFLKVNDRYLSKDKKQFIWNSSIEENCDGARAQYLSSNPDVKKAGLDPWSHYQNYGKKEGRVWPSCASSVTKKEVPSIKNDAASAAAAVNLLKLMIYLSENSAGENQNSQGNINYETPPTETLSENFIYICDDCGKMKTHYSEPMDDTPCPETRWGGRGYCSDCIWDDGKHQYTLIGRLGKHQYVCNGCHIAISISSEGISHDGACGARGNNCCTHNWIKEK